MTQLNALMLARGQDTIIDSLSISIDTDYSLPSAVRQGQAFLILNEVTNNALLTIKASDTTTVETIRNGYCLLIAKQANPTTNTHWKSVEILDEGAWTPLVAGQTTDPSSVTYTIQQGNYSRRNKLVFINYTLAWSAATGGTGNAIIKGIPYNSQVTGIDNNTGAMHISNIDMQVGYTSIITNVPNNVAFIQPRHYGDNVVATTLNISAFNSGTFPKIVTGSCHYNKV